jgi:hypothetical protein
VSKWVFIPVMLLYGLANISCHPKGNSQYQAPILNDTLIKTDPTHPSFKQTIKYTDALTKKKFVRVTAKQIINPKKLPLSFDLYWITGNQTLFLGSVVPFPSDNPGTFIIAIGGRLTSDGELELRLVLPDEWTRDDKVEVSFKRLELE